MHVSTWPSFDPALAAEDSVTLIVQVDGKVRDKLEVLLRRYGGDDPRVGARVRECAARDRRAAGGRARSLARRKLVNLVTGG
ncbi:MAG: hypothetical protein U0V56_12990 [Actinomycetota bacterium]